VKHRNATYVFKVASKCACAQTALHIFLVNFKTFQRNCGTVLMLGWTQLNAWVRYEGD